MSSSEALDEAIWSNREWAMHFGGIHENTVLFYFAKSPFFDPTSNNASVETQAMFNPSMTYLLGDRETFEGHLRTLQGLEYMVHLSPRDFGGEKPIGEGMWVIRKQNRRKRLGDEDQVSVLATYFVVGENIYMSPSVYNIIGTRMLSATATLSKLFQKASKLPQFSPALGNVYTTPNLKHRDTSLSSQTPGASKETTPMPTQSSQTDQQSKSIGNPAAAATPNKAADLATLQDAFAQFSAYGYEYMDENPLLGEPGSFVLSASRQSLKARQDAAAKKAQQQQQQQQPGLKAPTNAKSPARNAPNTPFVPRIKTEDLSGEKGNKSSDAPRSASGPKMKRRKSKAPNTPNTASPVSPKG